MPGVAFQGTVRQYESDVRKMEEITHRYFFSGSLSARDVPSGGLVKYEVTKSHPMSIISFVSCPVLSYRRTIEDVRNNKADVYLIWLIESGIFRTIQAGHANLVSAQSMSITASDDPFLQSAGPSDGKPFDAKIAIIPGALFRTYLPPVVGYLGKPISTKSGSGRAIRSLVDLLFGETSALSVRAQGDLGRQTLSLVREAVMEAGAYDDVITSLADKTMDSVLAFVDANLFDRDLSPRAVADGCGISIRYLHRLFERSNTSFSKHLLEARLAVARSWLVDEGMSHHSISRIAEGAGFSSNAHFSRAFKKATGISPRQERQRSYKPALRLISGAP